MNPLYHFAFLEALGWSLIDSFWQAGAVWIFYSILTLNGKKFTAAVRHNLAVSGMITSSILFFITLAFNYRSALHDESLFGMYKIFEEGIPDIPFQYNFIIGIVPYLSFVYLLVFFIFSVKMVTQFRVSKTVINKAVIPPAEHLIQQLDQLISILGINRTVRLWLSEKIESPLTVGIIKPLILLPAAALNHLTNTQIEAVIAHELVHIRRNDYLVNLLLTITELLFFFNSFSMTMLETAKKERENSCDDEVLALGFDPYDYSEALYLLGKYQTANNSQLTIAATGGGKKFLLQRIKRLLKLSHPSPSLFKPVTVFFLCLAVAGMFTRKPITTPDFKATQSASFIRETKLPETASIPVKYVEEVQVTMTPPKPPEPKKPGKIHPVSKYPVAVKPVEEEVPVLPEFDESGYQLPVTLYISDPETVEFSIIEHTPPVPPKPVTLERQLPYVPGSTFYRPSGFIKSGGKRTIHI
jgi:beta-lactamase regulating signal transducer with metallopeptidase domain